MNFHVMRFKWINLSVSLILLVGLLALTFQRFGGFALSIDFAGGIKIEVKTGDKLHAEALRNFFDKEKIAATVQLVDKASGDRVKIELGGKVQQDLAARAEAARAELDKKGYPINAIDYTKYLIQTTVYILPDTVENDYRIVDRITQNGEQRGDNWNRKGNLQNANHAQSQNQVMHRSNQGT